VDDFSVVEVDNSYGEPWLDNDPTEEGASMHIRVEVGNVTSTYRRRSEGYGVNKRVVPFWTIIFQLDMGRVVQVTWDSGCHGCSAETKCVDNQACSVPVSWCQSKADCDLKMYVGWFGTDKNGRYLTSAGKRLSRFRGQSVKDAFDNAVKQVNDVKVVVENAVG